MIVEDGVPPEQWKTIDFMFTEDADNAYKIQNLNTFFAHTAKSWQKKIDNIQAHLQKADIVPLDLRHLNTINRARLLNYVLSLPKEQQQQIQLIVSESK